VGTLWRTLQERKRNPRPGSYTAQLLAQGQDEIVKKVGEEAVEVILAAKSQGNERLVEETADLFYHVLVLLLANDLSWDDVLQELSRRHK
jgi:phosphoribosyl-ATP pyrophosphohydrolase